MNDLRQKAIQAVRSNRTMADKEDEWGLSLIEMANHGSRPVYSWKGRDTNHAFTAIEWAAEDGQKDCVAYIQAKKEKKEKAARAWVKWCQENNVASIRVGTNRGYDSLQMFDAQGNWVEHIYFEIDNPGISDFDGDWLLENREKLNNEYGIFVGFSLDYAYCLFQDRNDPRKRELQAIIENNEDEAKRRFGLKVVKDHVVSKWILDFDKVWFFVKRLDQS